MKKGDSVQFRSSTKDVTICGTGTLLKIHKALWTVEVKLETFHWEPVKLSYRKEFLLSDHIITKTTRNQVFAQLKPAACWAIGDPSREDLEITPQPLQRFMFANIYSSPSNYHAYESLARVEQNARGKKFEAVYFDCPKCGESRVGKNWGGALHAVCLDCRIDVSCLYPIKKPSNQPLKTLVDSNG